MPSVNKQRPILPFDVKFRISHAEHLRLEAICAERGVSLPTLMRTLVTDLIDHTPEPEQLANHIG